VSIVGLGLIGRSLASALRQRSSGVVLTGIEREEVVQAGVQAGLLDELLSEHAASAIDAAFAASQLIVLATPVSVIPLWLAQALKHPAIVTDCGSSKREIASAARRLPGAERFVPGHPMAGAGADRGATRSDLFDGRPWVLCPEGTAAKAYGTVEQLVTSVGARPVQLTVEEHDRAVAWTSHVPRLAASALIVLAEREGALVAAGPAFERLSRGAGGSVEMWGDVLASNADEVARALRCLLEQLAECVSELERGSVERTLALLAEADSARQRFDAAGGPTR
jgi:prephenate dehydrogenase